MLKRIRTVGAVLALATLSSLASAQDGFSIKRVAKAGEAIHYRLEMRGLQVSGTDATLSAPLVETVKEVRPDGTYSLEHMTGAGLFKVGEQEHPTSGQPGSLTVYKPNNELVEVQGPGVTEDSSGVYRVATLLLVVDPGKPVKVGDSWVHEFKTDKKTGARAARGEYKVLAEEKVGEFDTLKITAVVRETEGSEPAGSESTVWISKVDGSLVKSEAKWTRAPFPGQGQNNVTVTLTREASPKA